MVARTRCHSHQRPIVREATMQRLSRRAFVNLTFVTAVTSLLPACGGQTPQPTAGPPTAGPAARATGPAAASATAPAVVKAEIKREGLILANIEDTYGHASGM